MKKFLATILTFIIASTSWEAALSEELHPPVAELYDMCNEALQKRDYTKARKLALQLKEIGLPESEQNMIGYVNFSLGSSEVFLGEGEAGKLHLNEALQIAKNIGNDTLRGLVLNCLGVYEASVNSNYYVAQHYLLESLDCPAMEGNASSNLAQVALLQNDTSGVHYATRTYEYGKKTGENRYRCTGLIYLTEFAILKKDFKEAARYLEQAEQVAAQHGYKDMDYLKLLKANVLSHTGNTTESNRLLEAAKDDIATKLPIYLPELLYLMGENYHVEGNYTASNSALMKSAEAAEKYSSTTSLAKTYKLIAKNYSLMGLNGEAIPYIMQALELSETAGQTDRQRMVNERKLTLDVVHQEQKRLLAEEKARYNGRLSVFLGLLLLLASAIIVIVVTNLRRRNRLYRHIVQQNVAMLDNESKYIEKELGYKERIQELETLLATKTSDETIPDTEDKKVITSYVIGEEKSRQLFESLKSLMDNEKLYRNPQLTRETVMERLETNPTYLAQSIKDNTGMNYSQYVNSFRIRDALKALSDKSRIEEPIKGIALESGFNSMANFYKLFQQHTGISPTAYRKSLASIE
ncbi:MAG: AraC family transcriptional regulator [Bacteroides sp.]|nr:AraC family transcriptional regulator [Bacteroides sp.]